MITVDTDQVLTAFLESDSVNWVREPAIPPIERDAMYKCKLNVGGVLVTYEVLVYRRAMKQSDTTRKIVLSYALFEKPWFGNQLLEREVELSESGTDIASFIWPDTDDPVIRKIAKIAKAAPVVSLAPQSIN